MLVAGDCSQEVAADVANAVENSSFADDCCLDCLGMGSDVHFDCLKKRFHSLMVE